MLLSWVSANRSLYAADTTKNRCVTFPVWFLPVLILTTLWFRRSCDYVPLNTANILSSTTLRVVFSTVRRLITSAGFLMFTILYHIEHPFLKKTTLIKRLNNVWHGIIINRLSLCWIIMGGTYPKMSWHVRGSVEIVIFARVNFGSNRFHKEIGYSGSFP